MRLCIYSILTIFISVNCVFTQSTASKNVATFTIEAPQLNTSKQIWVYLPNDYHKSEKRYPVLYMHDAQNLFDDKTSYVGEWKVDEYLDTLKSNQAIVIGIEHGNNLRLDELTPFSNEKYGGGNGENYLLFIKNTLKPHVDASFKTITDSQNTTIFGSSLGGLLSFYAVIKYPDTFGKAGVFSASFWYSEEIYQFTENSTLNSSSKFYMLIGSMEGDDNIEYQNKMAQLLVSKGIPSKNFTNLVIEGGKHSESFWSTQFPNAFQWLVN